MEPRRLTGVEREEAAVERNPQLMSTGIVWSLVNLSAVGGGLDGRAGSTINEHGDRMVVRRAGVIVQY